jgi:Spy/CpxP family protein refolding chaperone
LAAGNLNKQGGETSALLFWMERHMNIKTKKILLLRIVFALISYLLIIFSAPASKAQPPFHPQSKPMLRMDGQNDCWESTDLGLTEAQEKALEGLQRVYALEALPLRIELMSLRFELRYLVRDPNVQSELLFDRQKKISQLQAKLDDLSLSYQIKARSIFTKEQLNQLPPGFSMGTGFGTDIGIGRGVRKGIR